MTRQEEEKWLAHEAFHAKYIEIYKRHGRERAAEFVSSSISEIINMLKG